MLKKLYRIATCSTVVFAFSLQASPTENEFADCQKLAVALLDACLKTDGEQCWSKSKTGYGSCREQVIQRHNRNSPINRAKIQAKKQVEKRLEEQAKASQEVTQNSHQ
ncbi:hypothetical protein [Thalassotalea maritima]|uniref:hypothetical protein n=1 Tax=Thalassotalea maritima TaxID=3242416 RepID=UPI0035297946